MEERRNINRKEEKDRKKPKRSTKGDRILKPKKYI